MASLISETAARSTGESSVSGVSWAAIIAGAVVIAVSAFILLILGSGLGLSMVSPWSGAGVGATTFAVSTAIWLVIVQWISAGLGGYLTGRLRTKWANTHADEVFFRDTAHGFLAWALATIVAAGLLGAVVTSVIGGGASAIGGIAAGAAQGASQGAVQQGSQGTGAVDPTDYFIDMLFRPSPTAAGSPPAASAQNDRAQVMRILVQSAASGAIAPDDKTYLAQIVSSDTGLSAAGAQQRVDMVLANIDQAKTKAKQVADAARKAGATLTLLTALSLLIGAFVASVAAVLGGRQRDEV